MSEAFASIIIPTYNQAQYLPAALESVIAQTDTAWEAIIVDDGSTDETPSVIQEFAQRDTRIVALRKENGGTSSALNLGLRHATGRWIHWLSSDDLFEPTKLAINRTWIERIPACKFFFSYFSLLHEANGACERRGLWGPIPRPEHQILTLLHRNYINGISVCIEREALMKVGGFDETLRYAQDFDLWIRLLKSYKAEFIPEWTVVTRVHVLQGSAVFSEACFYDTAMAAIKFLNDSRFEDLVPWTDLSDIDAVLVAIHTALDVSFDPTSFLYGLGPHPGLVLKILQWSSTATEDSVVSKIAEIVVEERIIEAALKGTDSDFRRVWRKLTHNRKKVPPDPWPCSQVDPVALGFDLHRRYLMKGDSRVKPLFAYLDQLYNGNLPVSISSEVDGGSAGRNLKKTETDLVWEQQADMLQEGQSPIQIETLKKDYSLLRLAVARMSEAARGKAALEAQGSSPNGESAVGVRLQSDLALWYAKVLKSAVESLMEQLKRGGQHKQFGVHGETSSFTAFGLSHEQIEIMVDRHLISSSGLFDASAYRAVNDDVAKAQIDPLDHYLMFGGREGRGLGGGFDAELYLSTNRDVAELGLNPLVHFLRYGFLEGRGLDCLRKMSEKGV